MAIINKISLGVIISEADAYRIILEYVNNKFKTDYTLNELSVIYARAYDEIEFDGFKIYRESEVSVPV